MILIGLALGSFHCRQLEEMALDYILARKQADILRREKGYALQEECRGNVLVPKIKRGGRERGPESKGNMTAEILIEGGSVWQGQCP